MASSIGWVARILAGGFLLLLIPMWLYNILGLTFLQPAFVQFLIHTSAVLAAALALVVFTISIVRFAFGTRSEPDPTTDSIDSARPKRLAKSGVSLILLSFIIITVGAVLEVPYPIISSGLIGSISALVFMLGMVFIASSIKLFFARK